MDCPVITATQLSLDWFKLREEQFDNALAKDVVFSVDATICTPGNPDQSYKAKVEGKDLVIASLAERHFAITEKIRLEKFDCNPLDGDRVKVDFISIETKKEAKSPETVTYRYTGHYDITFSKGEEGLKVKEIALQNVREIYSS